ncbi:MAG: hydrogenase maturation nickel metallochaperone HypA [Spirulina sp. SIO3F2]|nr:hydrogenase maturation nickel metallochaperone HypA [Spirulina sp. SIO3F2]
MEKENKLPQQLTAAELAEWQRRLAEANRNNVLCHCRQCDDEWVTSGREACHRCGSLDVEAIACWQFPDG